MTATVRTSSSARGGGQPRQRVPDSKVGGVTFGHVVHSEVTKL